ncbi:hypothetical protein J3R82DRAFT_560 [Butyriboletus roseoflavus]|nr:hypothetical protein J3R82DRAFT_560 [Butyriboletus roseoflavus]
MSKDPTVSGAKLTRGHCTAQQWVSSYHLNLLSGLNILFQCCSTSTASTSGTQSQTASSQSPTPTSTGEFDTSVLPAGWNDATSLSSNTESTIILALAIILAGSICVFMIACVIWRRRKKKSRDLERKHELATDDDSQDNVPEKDTRGKMRTWARASARWKSNIRQSARRRRKRPVVSSTVNQSLSPTFSDSPQAAIPSAPSRRRSFVSQQSDPSPLCLDGNLTEPPTVPHDTPRSASPPTYGASFVPELSRLRTSSAVSNTGSTPLPDSPHAVRHSNLFFFIEDEPLPYIPPSDGHVATDDKAQLAHIRRLASSPTAVDTADASTIPAAPEWHEIEDDLEDLGVDLSEVPVSLPRSDLPPSFPLPPSKADVPFGYLDDLSLPSGPLLEPSPSAPPIVDPGLEPSAPSLDGEDDLFQDWEGASSCDHEAPTSADLDSTPCAIESSVSPNVSSTSHTSFPCIRESAARNGILPRYHP